MNKIFLAIPVFLFVFGVNFAHAEPLNEINTIVSEYDKISATVEILWNHDETVTKYEIGCVSCMPNTSEFTFADNITINNVIPFTNTSNVMLYLIAYDSSDEIINAKQILVDIRV
jgi:hypothetical protein